uniref:Uncharacterized protein n=1 Tax=Peronospora matthiolae TaxID=2874970 RepID=A0AAV1U8Q8_9STRA
MDEPQFPGGGVGDSRLAQVFDEVFFYHAFGLSKQQTPINFKRKYRRKSDERR